MNSDAEARQYFHLGELMDAGLFSWDTETNIVFGDASFAAIFGFANEDARQGVRLDDLLGAIIPLDRPNVERAIMGSARQCSRVSITYRVRQPDGETINALGIGQCFPGSGATHVRYVGMVIPLGRAAGAEVSFATSFNDGQWKVYRDDGLVAVFPTEALAEAAVAAFAQEVVRNGRTASVELRKLITPDDD